MSPLMNCVHVIQASVVHFTLSGCKLYKDYGQLWKEDHL
jgi:hypothetical protein